MFDGTALPFCGPVTLVKGSNSLQIMDWWGIKFYVNPTPAPPAGEVVVPAWAAKHAGKHDKQTAFMHSRTAQVPVNELGQVMLADIDELFADEVSDKSDQPDKTRQEADKSAHNGGDKVGPVGSGFDVPEDPEVYSAPIFLRNAVTQTDMGMADLQKMEMPAKTAKDAIQVLDDDDSDGKGEAAEAISSTATATASTQSDLQGEAPVKTEADAVDPPDLFLHPYEKPEARTSRSAHPGDVGMMALMGLKTVEVDMTCYWNPGCNDVILSVSQNVDHETLFDFMRRLVCDV